MGNTCMRSLSASEAKSPPQPQQNSQPNQELPHPLGATLVGQQQPVDGQQVVVQPGPGDNQQQHPLNSENTPPNPSPQPPSTSQQGSGNTQGSKLPSDMGVAPSSPSVINKSRLPKALRILEGVPSDIRAHYDFGEDKMGRIIGKGQFGTVRVATSKEDGREVAVKSIAKRKLLSQIEIDDVRREVAILHHLVGHPAVAQIYGVFEDRHYVHIVMQLAQGGELFERIVACKRYSEQDAAAVFRTMVSVILHCHRMGVIHRDLKPENFLLADASADAQLICTDFGLSTFYKEREMFHDLVGSAYYVAPEVIQRNYSKECDMWSLGVILYILLSGSPPFYGPDENSIFSRIMEARPDLETIRPWPHISAPAKELIMRLLVRDPSQRMTAQEALAHPWVQPEGVATDTPIHFEVVCRLEAFAKQNKLKKEASKIIASMLPEIEVMGLREMFQGFDADNSGHITVGELQKALQDKGHELPLQEIRKLLSGTDLNQDRIIDYEEFIAATTHESKISREEMVFHAFQVLDTDNSGFIDPHELMNVIRKHGGGGADEDAELQEILNQVDRNDDGRIDYDEFSQMMYAQAIDTYRGDARISRAMDEFSKAA